MASHVRTIVQDNLEQSSHPGNLSSEILTSLFKDGDCKFNLKQLNEKQEWSALKKPGLLPSCILGFATFRHSKYLRKMLCELGMGSSLWKQEGHMFMPVGYTENLVSRKKTTVEFILCIIFVVSD